MYDTLTAEDATVPYPVYMKYRLLLSEALFKNDYQQPDTFTINKIVNYYDSLGTIMRANKDLQFQRARAYYYQGVTRQEQDDIVGTCQAFLNSLEIMETNFAEKDMDYDKTRFMALIYSRLGALFLFEIEDEKACSFYKKSLYYFEKINDTVAVAQFLRSIGDGYLLVKEFDSARIAYNQALIKIGSKDHLIYKDAMKGIAFIFFNKRETDSAFVIMKQLISTTTHSDKHLYEFILGKMYYYSNQVDSAILYLKSGFLTENRFSKLVASNMLNSLYEGVHNYDTAKIYNDYYIKESYEEIEKTNSKFQILSCYENYNLNKAEKKQKSINKETIYYIILPLILIVFILLLLLYLKVKSSNKLLEEKFGYINRLTENNSMLLNKMCKIDNTVNKYSWKVNMLLGANKYNILKLKANSCHYEPYISFGKRTITEITSNI